MGTPKETPLENEKKTKSDAIIDNNKPGGEPAKKKKPGRPKGSGKKKSPPEQEPYNPEEGLKQGMFFLEMMSKMRLGMGITKPIDELTAQTFVQSIPAMEMKYGAAVSKYMPEMMFFGSGMMIALDTVKELKIIRIKKSEESEKGEDGQGKQD